MRSLFLFVITAIFSLPAVAQGNMGSLAAAEVVDRMKSNLTCSWAEKTVDTFKSGGPESQVTGIACTFMATVDVLERAAAQGCNMVITHEPTYYNHLDQTDQYLSDPVYKAKLALIEENNMVVFRFHDHWHRTNPDGIYVGMIDKLQWKPYLLEGRRNIFNLQGQTLEEITAYLTEIFPDAIIRVIGDPALKVNNAAFSAGAPGSQAHIRHLRREDINLVVIGEAPEWESLSYVRDASQAGFPKAMIILGHTVSEEAGMEYCAQWMDTFIDEIPVKFIESGDPFHQ